MDFRLVAGLQLPWYCKALGLPLRVGVGARCGGTFVVFGPSGFSWACFNDVGLRQASRRNVCFKCVQVCECVCVFVLVFSLCVCLKVKSHSVPSRSWGPKSISWPSCSISDNGKAGPRTLQVCNGLNLIAWWNWIEHVHNYHSNLFTKPFRVHHAGSGLETKLCRCHWQWQHGDIVKIVTPDAHSWFFHAVDPSVICAQVLILSCRHRWDGLFKHCMNLDHSRPFHIFPMDVTLIPIKISKAFDFMLGRVLCLYCCRGGSAQSCQGRGQLWQCMTVWPWKKNHRCPSWWESSKPWCFWGGRFSERWGPACSFSS